MVQVFKKSLYKFIGRERLQKHRAGDQEEVERGWWQWRHTEVFKSRGWWQWRHTEVFKSTRSVLSYWQCPWLFLLWYFCPQTSKRL